MMSEHLFVIGRVCIDEDHNIDCVKNEVAAGVHEGPDVEIARSIEAVVVIKWCLAIGADIPDGCDCKGDTRSSMDGPGGLPTILTLRLLLHLQIALVIEADV